MQMAQFGTTTAVPFFFNETTNYRFKIHWISDDTKVCWLWRITLTNGGTPFALTPSTMISCNGRSDALTLCLIMLFLHSVHYNTNGESVKESDTRKIMHHHFQMHCWHQSDVWMMLFAKLAGQFLFLTCWKILCFKQTCPHLLEHTLLQTNLIGHAGLPK